MTLEVRHPVRRIRQDTERFARLNGWRRTRREFPMGQLCGRRGRNADLFPLVRRGEDPHHVMDHLFWFNRGRRPVAIGAMPYNAHLGQARMLAARYGLEVQAPPIEKSGWWYPGSARCFAFVQPGTAVQWLLEQTQAL